VVDAGDVRHARHDTGRQDDLIEPGQHGRIGLCRQFQVDPKFVDARREIAQRLQELMLTRDGACQLELPANAGLRFEDRNRMPAFG